MVAAAALVGCGAEATGPPPISTGLRQSVKQNLMLLGAKVTSDDAEGLYVSLRNTHVQVRKSGGVVEGYPRTRRDLQDFGLVNEAVAKGFLDGVEFTAFQRWLRQAMSPTGAGADRAEYSRFQLSVSKVPLRVVFSQRTAPVE